MSSLENFISVIVIPNKVCHVPYFLLTSESGAKVSQFAEHHLLVGLLIFFISTDELLKSETNHIDDNSESKCEKLINRILTLDVL